MTESAATPSAPPPPVMEPLKGGALILASIGIALGTFIQVLDSTIANVSLPTIAGNLGVASDQGTWVITSFAVANGIGVPLTGWLMGRFGVVKVFVVAVILFTLSSLACGLAWNLESLIAFRVLQGAVSGPLIPGSMALMMMIFPPNRRSVALAVWSMTTLVAPICGPILGGYISDNFSWRWIFLINVPVGSFCAYICWFYMKSRETPTFRRPVDKVGFALLVFWVGALQIMLDTGKDADWFNSPAIIVETICAAIGFIAWVVWEAYEPYPIVDVKLFVRSRNFTISVIVMCVSYAVFFGNNLLMPIWLQTNLGYIATWAGLSAAPMGLVAVVLTPLGARLLNRYDSRILASAAMGLFGLSFYLRSLYVPNIDFPHLIIPMFVAGGAMSVYFISMTTIMMRDISPQQTPMASGLSSFARIVAGSFAASLATTIWPDIAASIQSDMVGHLGVMSSAGPSNGAGLSALQSSAVVSNLLNGQALMRSMLGIFRISSLLVLFLIPLIWLARRSMSDGHAPAAGD